MLRKNSRSTREIDRNVCIEPLSISHTNCNEHHTQRHTVCCNRDDLLHPAGVVGCWCRTELVTSFPCPRSLCGLKLNAELRHQWSFPPWHHLLRAHWRRISCTTCIRSNANELMVYCVHVQNVFSVFAARCYASAAYFCHAVSVCLSVSVCHVREFCQNE